MSQGSVQYVMMGVMWDANFEPLLKEMFIHTYKYKKDFLNGPHQKKKNHKKKKKKKETELVDIFNTAIT